MTLAIRQGEALHRLMEWADWLPPLGDWSLDQAWPQRLLAPFGLSTDQQLRVWQVAESLLRLPGVVALMGIQPGLQSGFQPGPHSGAARSLIEREWLDAEGQIRRPDRVVFEEGVCRILDFKWRVLASEREDYAKQLRDYVAVLSLRHPGQRVEAYILSGEPSIWRLQPEGLVHWEPAGRPAL